ncbi:MAG TPA: NAD(P)/FAD-dependent oxidoreductase [Candidatus Sulfotelmatobacter sp.]|nr:NAD(P)/FAD-dependent oxidoreductase [Candidatus Sulfotelmatobacter sp.]
MYDVAIVGARCAGASLAMLLAQRGWRVALVDRAQFPSDTISTHFLWQRGAAHLKSWGLLPRLRRLGCMPLPELTFDFGRVSLTGPPPPVDGVSDSYCPRRTVLDSLLVEAATDAGVDLLEQTAVMGMRWSEGRAGGIVIRGGNGATKSLEARVVVGADGRHSSIARETQAQAYRWIPSLTFVYYSYWSGLSSRVPVYHMRAGRLILRWPTNDGLTCIYVGSSRSEFAAFRRDIEGNFLRALECVEGLRDEVAAGRREERFRGSADLPNFYRTAYGSGWVLVGDAGHHKDPATGFGISDAFAAAEVLATAVHSVLARERSWLEAMSAYEKWRDASTKQGFERTIAAASLRPVSHRIERHLADAAGKPDEVTHVIGVLGGIIPAEEVFSGVAV